MQKFQVTPDISVFFHDNFHHQLSKEFLQWRCCTCFAYVPQVKTIKSPKIVITQGVTLNFAQSRYEQSEDISRFLLKFPCALQESTVLNASDCIVAAVLLQYFSHLAAISNALQHRIQVFLRKATYPYNWKTILCSLVQNQSTWVFFLKNNLNVGVQIWLYATSLISLVRTIK